jgi:hypothetical protein
LPTTDAAKLQLTTLAIALEHTQTNCHVHFINEIGTEEPEPGVEVASTACLGTAAQPKATSGNLCVYAASVTNVLTGNIGIKDPVTNEIEEAGTTGATMQTAAAAAGALAAKGTWAVTG